MVDRLRPDRLLEVDHGVERNQIPGRRLERDTPERISAQLIPRIQLEEHAVLCRLPVDRRRPLWSQTVVQSGLELRRVEPDLGRLVPVDDEVDPRALDLHVRGYVLD